MTDTPESSVCNIVPMTGRIPSKMNIALNTEVGMFFAPKISFAFSLDKLTKYLSRRDIKWLGDLVPLTREEFAEAVAEAYPNKSEREREGMVVGIEAKLKSNWNLSFGKKPVGWQRPSEFLGSMDI